LARLKYSLILSLVAGSEGEMDFKEKTLDAILLENRGCCIRSRDCEPIGSFLGFNILRASVVPLIFRMGGIFGATMAGDDAPYLHMDWSESAAEIKQKWISRGAILDDLIVNHFRVPYENNNIFHSEEIFLYDRRDRAQSEQLASINIDFTLSTIGRCVEPLMGIVPPIEKIVESLNGRFQ
jgi:hypothetical protein